MSTIEPTADAVRLAIADAVQDAITFCDLKELPHSEDTLGALESALRQNRFTVLVCGEAKRGKSTFINALIGRSLLPTDVDIATSQVFQIRSAEQESFLVRYEDDSGQFIAADDLALHGSQVVQDALKDSSITPPDMTVRQIEVTVPTTHLPEEITLLDTPGLGSLYSGHARITYRFMSQADAVIFVLDSQAPITQPELAFLSEIIPVTTQIFFLQTRIDQFQQSDWQAVYERNTALLRETFGETLSQGGDEILVWPVSSKNLLLASRTGSKELLQVSRFPAMVTALRRFLFQVTGVARARHVLTQMSSLHQELRPILQARVAAATGVTTDYDPEARIAAFQNEWGPESRWRRELNQRLPLIRERYTDSFRSALQPGSDIENILQSKIDSLSDIANAERLARSLASDAIERTNLLWRQTSEQATNAVSELIAPLCGRLRGDSALIAGLIERPLAVEDIMTVQHTTRVKDTWANRARLTWRESGVLGGVGAAVGMIRSSVEQILDSAVKAASGTTWFRSGGKLAEQAKPELTEYLQGVLSEIRSLYGATETEMPNRTDRFFDELEAATQYAINREYAKKLVELEREAELLRNLSVEGSTDALAVAGPAEALARWDDWGHHLRSLDHMLDQVATMPPPTASPTQLQPVSPDKDAARDSIRARVRIAAENGNISEQEKQRIISEGQKRGLIAEEASAIVDSALASPEDPAFIAPVAEPVQNPLVAFRLALVNAIRESDDDEISDEVHHRLDEMAEAANLTRSATRRMEREIREELAAAQRAATETAPELSPQEKYAARFRVSLAQAGGPDAELSDNVLDELDDFATTLSLARSEIRQIERDVQRNWNTVEGNGAAT